MRRIVNCDVTPPIGVPVLLIVRRKVQAECAQHSTRAARSSAACHRPPDRSHARVTKHLLLASARPAPIHPFCARMAGAARVQTTGAAPSQTSGTPSHAAGADVGRKRLLLTKRRSLEAAKDQADNTGAADASTPAAGGVAEKDTLATTIASPSPVVAQAEAHRRYRQTRSSSPKRNLGCPARMSTAGGIAKSGIIPADARSTRTTSVRSQRSLPPWHIAYSIARGARRLGRRRRRQLCEHGERGRRGVVHVVGLASSACALDRATDVHRAHGPHRGARVVQRRRRALPARRHAVLAAHARAERREHVRWRVRGHGRPAALPAQ
jgi:hypothetical protein